MPSSSKNLHECDLHQVISPIWLYYPLSMLQTITAEHKDIIYVTIVTVYIIRHMRVQVLL